MASLARPSAFPYRDDHDSDPDTAANLSASTPNHAAKKKTLAFTPSPVQLRLDSKFDAVGGVRVPGVPGVESARRCLDLTGKFVSGAPVIEELPVIDDGSPKMITAARKTRAKRGQAGSYFQGHPPPKNFDKKVLFEKQRAAYYAARLLTAQKPRPNPPRSNLHGRVAGLCKARHIKRAKRARVEAKDQQV